MELSNRQIKDIKTVCTLVVSDADKRLEHKILLLELKMAIMQRELDKMIARNKKIHEMFWTISTYYP